MLINDGGDSGAPSAPAVDYHVMTMSQLQAALTTAPKSIQAVQQAWQSFASVLSAYTTGPGCPLDAAVKGIAGGWSGEASAHFMKRVGEVSDFAAQLGGAASVQASGGSAPNGEDFDGATWTIADSIDRMNRAHQDYTNAVRDCLKDFMNGLCGNNFSIGHLKTTPNGQVANANTLVEQQGYDFTYTAAGYLDDIVLTGSCFPYVSHTFSGGRGAAVVSRADGSAVVTATVAAPVPQPGESPSMTAQVTLNPGTDVEWAWKTFQVPVLWHQLAILLNYTTPIAYQMPVKMFPVPPKSPGQPQKQGSGGSGTGGSGTGFGGGSFGGGSGTGFGGGAGGFGGGGAPGTGVGGLPGGGGGAPGTGVGGLPGGAPGTGVGSVGGGPGSLGGGSGSTPTHLAGLGGAGLPGGLGGGGLPGGFGGAGLPGGGGGLPGGLGGLANAGRPGGLGPGGAAGAAANEAAIAAHGEVPLMPPMMPPMMNQNQDNTRQRKSWLPEDEDLWGGAVDAVPPVISSDG